MSIQGVILRMLDELLIDEHCEVQDDILLDLVEEIERRRMANNGCDATEEDLY